MSGSTARRVARNTLFSAVGEGSNLLLFLLGFLAARLLGPVGFGQYTAAFAFVASRSGVETCASQWAGAPA